MSRLGKGAIALSVFLMVSCAGDPQSAAATPASPASPVVADDHGHDHPQIDAVARISPADIAQGVDTGTIVVLDVRSAGQYEAGHIRGSLHIPVGEIEVRSGELPRDRMIVTYCT